MNALDRRAFLAACTSCLYGVPGCEVQSSPAPPRQRRVLSLDGSWQIAEGSLDSTPARFDREVKVPGLVDMAAPPFSEIGTEAGQARRQAFYYRKTFAVEGQSPDVARLKLHKLKYGAKVYLNGEPVGEHLPCFTPALLDVERQLRIGEPNELVIRVGAYRTSVPRSIPDGFDFEKTRYIPGIYDSVELLMSGTPHIVHAQVVPDVAKRSIRVVTEIASTRGADRTDIDYRIVDGEGNVVGRATTASLTVPASGTASDDVSISIDGCRLWSPEDPYLYHLEIATARDQFAVRFGVRSFSFDAISKRALLNGKPYPMRGTNVTLLRFFEDALRGDLPWREDWVRKLHEAFKSMHWNSARYCIGFPPEKWYDIADEVGLLIQDEFPIWYLDEWPVELQAEELVREYTAWVRERVNHACVVIWDAQNETSDAPTGDAVEAVRALDLSGRPWENGWSGPLRPADPHEVHRYPFFSWDGVPTEFRLEDMAREPSVPLDGKNPEGNPVILNEYGWLWLNRDGTPTRLSQANYDAIWPGASIEQRRAGYARYLAAMTEYWRCHRGIAGIFHFCGLGYSRPDGETSDNFVDVAELVFEKNFARYVRDAFAPVGLLLDYFAERASPGERLKITVIVINDLKQTWQGDVALVLMRGDQQIKRLAQPCQVDSIGRTDLSFELELPEQTGPFRLIAELVGADGETVQSVRDLSVSA